MRGNKAEGLDNSRDLVHGSGGSCDDGQRKQSRSCRGCRRRRRRERRLWLRGSCREGTGGRSRKRERGQGQRECERERSGGSCDDGQRKQRRSCRG